ncbi:MAG: serine/threonine protein kinase, partial [Myxococcales bacterium]|nr:serine/threonine protein kinase [Myxococcales bacterium]
MNASGSTLVQGQIVDGKYRVLRVLGEGGMGVVYLARSIHTDVDVVIKSVHPEYAHRADIRQRTLDEGKALARIDHPNVVPLKSVVVDDGQLLLVMQYIEGVDLEQRILRHVELGKPMPFEEVLRIFRMVLHGVGAAHDEGVIHRDLKP